jgi:hypothetical protein
MGMDGRATGTGVACGYQGCSHLLLLILRAASILLDPEESILQLVEGGILCGIQRGVGNEGVNQMMLEEVPMRQDPERSIKITVITQP